MMADAGDEISERDSAPTLADDPRFHGLRFLHQQQSQRQQEQLLAESAEMKTNFKSRSTPSFHVTSARRI